MHSRESPSHSGTRTRLEDLASFRYYRSELAQRGFREVAAEPLTQELRNHYTRVAEELDSRRDELTADDAFVDRMLAGLEHWVTGAERGLMAWGILLEYWGRARLTS